MRCKIFLLSFFLILISPVNSTNASEGCGFGKEFAGNGSETCVNNLWKFEKFNDGFAKYISITLNPDTDISNNVELFNTLSVKCEKRKIHIYIYMGGYIDLSSFDMTESGSVIEYGSLSLKIDGGKIQKWEWKRRFHNEIELSSPDKFMLGLTKSKTRLSLKISREDAPSILVYPKSDILKYRSVFSQAGCKY